MNVFLIISSWVLVVYPCVYLLFLSVRRQATKSVNVVPVTCVCMCESACECLKSVVRRRRCSLLFSFVGFVRCRLISVVLLMFVVVAAIDGWMIIEGGGRERNKAYPHFPLFGGFHFLFHFVVFYFFNICDCWIFSLFKRLWNWVCMCVLGPLCRGRRFAMWFELLSRGEYFYGCSWDERVDNNILHCCGSVLRGGCWKGYWTFFVRFVYLLTLYSPIWLSVVMAGAAKRCCCSDEWQFLNWQTIPK